LWLATGFFPALALAGLASRLILTGCGAAGPGSVNGGRIAPAPCKPPVLGIRAGIAITLAGWFCSICVDSTRV
jgi:hypothetical protein